MEFKKRDIKIIILSGKARSGKDTIANKMIDILNNYNKKSIKLAYASYLKMYAKNILNWDGNEEDKPREFLQQLGVELIKNNINPKMLINRIIEDIEVYSYFYDVIIISDARFKEEIEDIKIRYNTKVIHILGDNNDLTEEQKNHSTEVSLDDYNNYDFEIDKYEENLDNIVRKCL